MIESTTLTMVIVFAAVAISGYLIFAGVSKLVTERMVLARRLQTAEERKALAETKQVSLLADDGALRQFEKYVEPKTAEARSAISERFIRAGKRNPSAVRWFYVQKALFAVIFAVVAAIYALIFAAKLPVFVIMAIVLSMAVVGLMFPSFLLSRGIQKRQEAIQDGFADAMDMLLVCVEAGMGLDQALTRLSVELTESCRPLAEELKLVCAEMRAGKERTDVLDDFAGRVQLDDVSAFVTVLAQSAEFGVSIADSLRVFTAEMREKRISRAEEKANAMPMKLALGSVMFTVPPVGVLLAGPSIIMMMRSFNTIAGG